MEHNQLHEAYLAFILFPKNSLKKSSCLNGAVVLVSLLRSNLIRVEESQAQLFVHTFLRDLVFAKLMIRSATITAFIFFVLHHRRLPSA
jgi:hypothetical protein